MATTAAYGSGSNRGFWHHLWLGPDYALEERSEGEFAFYISQAKSFGEDAVVLDLATCGARIPMVLAKAGIKKIYAMDASDEILALTPKAIDANLSPEEKQRIILVKGDMRWFSLAEGVDLVTVAFNSFWYNFGIVPRGHDSLMTGHEQERLELAEAKSCLRSILRALKKGGRFIINTPLAYGNYFSVAFPSTHTDVENKRGFWWSDMAQKLGFTFTLNQYDELSQGSSSNSVLVGTKS